MASIKLEQSLKKQYIETSACIDHGFKPVGEWTVLSYAGRDLRGRQLMQVRCSCGKLALVTQDNLNRGKSTSCGHVNPVLRKHTKGRDGKPSHTYLSWQAMRTRCLNPNSVDYTQYGGRGICIDPRWDNFLLFLEDMGERPVGKTLDRIDVNGNYTLHNCRWATAKEQRANQRPHKRSCLCPVQ